jgi:hypothetical protein
MTAIKETSPGRLEIREGGGGLALFGLPFFVTGIFMTLASIGVVTMRSVGEPVTRATLLLLGVLFTLVGALLVFGRSITAIDVGQHVITTQWRLLLPVRTWTYQLADYTTVTLASCEAIRIAWTNIQSVSRGAPLRRCRCAARHGTRRRVNARRQWQGISASISRTRPPITRHG